MLFSILTVISKGCGLNREGGLLQNLTAKGRGEGLIREGGLKELLRYSFSSSELPM